MSRRIYVRDLKAGCKLEGDVNHQGKILLKKGTVLTENKVELIRKWFKTSDACVNIADESEVIEKHAVDAIHKLYLSAKISPEAFEEVKECMQQLVVNVELLEEISCDMQDIADEYEEAKERHLFRVARLAIALANVYNNTIASEKINLADIGMAAVLHDYGKTFENRPKDIRKLKGDKEIFKKLNFHSQFLKMSFSEEWHSVYAYLALNSIPVVSKIVLLSGIHDDIMNAKFGEESRAVRAAAKIITLCYVYDELLEAVIKGNVPLPLENVLSVINHGVENGNLSREAYKLLKENIQVYAPGTEVILTTGEHATVVKNSENYPTKPMVYTDNTLGARRFVDLSEETTITIKHIVMERKNTDSKVHDIQSTQLNKIVKQEEM